MHVRNMLLMIRLNQPGMSAQHTTRYGSNLSICCKLRLAFLLEAALRRPSDPSGTVLHAGLQPSQNVCISVTCDLPRQEARPEV